MCRCATTLLSDVDPAEAAAELLRGETGLRFWTVSDSHNKKYDDEDDEDEGDVFFWEGN